MAAPRRMKAIDGYIAKADGELTFKAVRRPAPSALQPPPSSKHTRIPLCGGERRPCSAARARATAARA